MKKIFILIALLSCSLLGFSQSFSVDNRSMSVPRYTNQAAITAAIPTPTNGMLVYNNALNQYAYWNGTAWTNVSTGAAAGPALWSISASNFIKANPGYPNGIEVGRIYSPLGTTLSAPLINTDGSAEQVLRFGLTSSSASVFQQSNTGVNLASSSISWGYQSHLNAAITTSLFGYNGSNNTFSVIGNLDAGGFTKLGNEAPNVLLGVTRSTPAIQTRLLTGNIAATNTQTTIIAHGLTWNKIIDVKVLVSGLGNITVAENYVDLSTTGPRTGYQFSTFTDPTNIYITRSSSNSANITPAAGLVPTYRILITYIP